MTGRLAGFLVGALLFATGNPQVEAGDESDSALDYAAIASPTIFRGDHKFAYRDPAVTYHEGVLYLYFTLSENAADGGYYNRTAYSKSRDLVHWSYPVAFTPRDRELNHSSPGNIVRYGGRWILCLQTYPTPGRETFGTGASRIWILRSDDLEHWSAPELLRVKGPDVAVADMGRMIDPYLIEDAAEPGKWWCFYKQRGASMSFSRDLETWTYVGRCDAGENVTVLRQDGRYVMFHSPRNGIGVKRSNDLGKWEGDAGHLTLGQAGWPWAQGRLTAATVIDLRREPRFGKYLMLFHGSTREGLKRQPAHGAASIGLAWSDDLVEWDWPAKAHKASR